VLLITLLLDIKLLLLTLAVKEIGISMINRKQLRTYGISAGIGGKDRIGVSLRPTENNCGLAEFLPVMAVIRRNGNDVSNIGYF